MELCLPVALLASDVPLQVHRQGDPLAGLDRDAIQRTRCPAPDEAEATALGDELIPMDIKHRWTAD